MTQEAIFLPVCLLAFLTIAVLTLVPFTRIRAMKTGRAHVKDFRYGESANVPGDVSLSNRDYMNLLELPVLFYVVCLALYATKRVDDVYIYLAWGFFAARLLHSIVHLTYNNVLHRFIVFGLGLAVLITMWVRFGMSLLAAS
jgi:hypothetical protein